jgi:hypothetical protein
VAGSRGFLKVAGSYLAALGLNKQFFLFLSFIYTKIRLIHDVSLVNLINMFIRVVSMIVKLKEY